MMQTCKACSDNCRGCFGAVDGAQFCYECLHGFLFEEEVQKCVIDPVWRYAESEFKVRFSQESISQCDKVNVLLDSVAGFDPTKYIESIVWTIQIENMEVNKELSLYQQKIMQKATGNPVFNLDHKFTSMLKIGSQI